MSGMLEFAARVLEREGALVESTGSGVSAVLPAAAREALGLEEYSLLTDGAGGGVPCGYGSEALGKIARLALGPGRAAAFRADLPECTAQVPAGLVGINVSLRVAGARSERRWTLIGLARYRASADDQREGLCRAAVGAPDGVPVPPPDLDLLPLSPVAPGEVPEDVLRAALPRLLSGLKRQAVEDLSDFREAVARRRRRDAGRLRRYFDEVESDLRRRLGRKGGEALRGKLDSLPAELRQKLAQIEADSVVRVRMDLAGLVAVLGPGMAADLEVRRRKHTRSLEVRYDGIAKKWTGLRCDGCGAAITAFALCDEAVHVLCVRCWDSCGSGGHRPCFRCEGKPERAPWIGGAPPAAAPAATGRPLGFDEPPRRNLPPSRPEDPPFPENPGSVPPPVRAVPEAGQGAADPGETALTLLRKSPEPLRSEDLRAALGIEAKELREALAPLIAQGLVGRVGERRGTRYFWAGGSGPLEPGDPEGS